MMGIALILSSFELSKLRKRNVVTLLLPLIILLLIAQARQAIFGTFIILFIRLIIDTRISLDKKIWFSVILAFASLLILTNLKSKAIEGSMNATTLSQSLNRDYDNAFKILETDFILGKGLGGFSTNGARAYPHNLFLELFCELGMVGTLFDCYDCICAISGKTRSISFIDYIQLLCSSFNSSHIY
ncbi:MAG: O-antigen ligase family protein [Parabacteroides merdae]